MSMSACPGCGFNKKTSLLSGAYFNVYRCKECNSEYCYECRGSNGARKCPRCSSTSRREIGKVYLR